MQLEEDILRDFGAAAGGREATGSVSSQRQRASRIAEHIIEQSEIPAASYFFQGSSSRSTFLTVSHSHPSDLDVVLLCDRQWLRAKGAESFAGLTQVLYEYVVSHIHTDDLHYMGLILEKGDNKFTFTEGRCGGWCQDECMDFVLAYNATDADGALEPGAILVFDRVLNRWRKNNPDQLAILTQEAETRQMYYSLVVRMLKEWNEYCPPIRKHGTVPGAVKHVKMLLVELPEEFGGGMERIVLDEANESKVAEEKLKHPMTGLHIEMALCLQHEGLRDTFWAKHMASGCSDPRTEELLAYEPETPCAIDLLVGAVEHLMVTLGVPIWTLGDEMRANEAMLSDAELRQRTWELLQGLHLELQKLQREPKTPDATGFLRSRLLRNHCQWDDYH
ncbi:unnamed protein product [Durusdinium trenchii]|uniref:Nucleotidyltransferase n=1 Tax=Durusdinium trenchii TaxID=1381693 RepID=A0ABP0M379_9DINO